MAFPSTFADLKNAVIAKTRLDPGNTADVSKTADWINQAYWRVALETETLQANTTQPLTAGTFQYTLPASAKRIKYLIIQQSGQTYYGPPLRLVSFDEILWRRQSTGGTGAVNGTATHYAFSSPNLIDLWPTPGANDTMQVYYVGYPPVMSAGTDTPQMDEPYASKLIEYGALIEAADYIKDTIASYTYPQSFSDWMYRYRQHLSRKAGTQSLTFRVPGPMYPTPHDNSVDTGYS